MSTYVNTPEKNNPRNQVQQNVNPSAPSMMVQQDVARQLANGTAPNVGDAPSQAGNPVQGNGMVQTPVNQVQPLNIFAHGGQQIQGRFESPTDATRQIYGVSPQNINGVVNGNASVQNTNGNSVSGNVAPYAPPTNNGAPYINRWDELAEKMKNDGAWNDMYQKTPANTPEYSSLDPNGGPRSSLDVYLDGGKKEEKPLPEYHDDKTKRDGGFLGWLQKNFGNPRGIGESDDDYDRRITNNNKKMAALADALRHFGNLVNTSKGGMSQTFNNPVQQMEAEYQQRKAQRVAEYKVKSDAMYKAANLQIKQDAAKANQAYKALSLQFKANAEKRAQDKADSDAKQRDYTNRRNADNDKFNHDMQEKKFNQKLEQDKISNGFKASQLAISQGRLNIAAAKEAREAAGGGSGGSFTNIATPSGQMHRKKALDSVEKRQVWQKMKEMGLITPDLQKKFDFAMTTQEQGSILNGAIAYAARDPRKKNNAFREYLRLHHGYTETNTTSQPKPASKPASKAASKPSSKGKSGGRYGMLK